MGEICWASHWAGGGKEGGGKGEFEGQVFVFVLPWGGELSAVL